MTAHTRDHALETRVVQWLTGPCALEDGQPIVVACSGGGDSVGLVELLGRCRERWPIHQVIFVDHGLRPVEDEARCSRMAAEGVGAPWRRLKVDMTGPGNVQARARDRRYEALLAVTPAGAVLATGHTMDDQAETVLQRAIRGSGIRGLAGIHARDGVVVRPLLGVRRSDLRGLGLAFSDDPTNATDRYQRNRIRHDVLPVLNQENPRAIEALAAVANQAANGQLLVGAILSRLADGELDLRGLDAGVAETWIRWWLDGSDGVGTVSRGAVAEFAERLVGGEDGGISLGGGVRGVSQDGRGRLEADEDPRSRMIAVTTGTYAMGNATLYLGTSAEATPDRDCVSIHHTWLEAHGVEWPLTLRRGSAREDRSTKGRWQVQDGAGRVLRLEYGPSTEPPNDVIVPFVVELVVR